VLWSALTPSASLFKLVTTAALVEAAKIRPEHRVCSEGGEHRLGLEQLEAPKHGKVRCQPFSSILATSRNAAYARLVTSRLKSDELTEYAKRFGFNNVRTSELPIELGRYHPADDPLDLARTATGFVGSSLSTFGAAYLGFVIANGGFNKPIQLLCSQQERDDLDSVEQVLSTATAKRLREMMEAVVRHGTAYEAFYDATGHPRLPGLSVAGKTGTLGHDEGTNSWFTGFAPSRNPKFVVAVLLDNGAVYRTTAKNVAVEMLRDLFPPQTPPSSPVRTTLKEKKNRLRDAAPSDRLST
jgi:cell division protein FtsI/penicillin-binding protein 2